MFHVHNQQLFCEQVAISTLAAAERTPLFVYSLASLQQRAAAFGTDQPRRLVCFALKANSNPALLRRLAGWGFGADVTSGGELFLALHAGIAPHKIIFSGVGKHVEELNAAMDADIKAIHVESEMEWERVADLAAARQQVVPIGLRMNPNIPVETHPYISTGLATHKFGIDVETAVSLYHRTLAYPRLTPVGIAFHIGSQITDLTPFKTAVRLLIEQANKLRAAGVNLTYIDVGGGLGIDYANESAPSIAEWVTAVSEPVLAAGYDLVIEPGRSLVGKTAVLVTEVQYLKEKPAKSFVIVDAAMNDLLRPTLYQARHRIQPVTQQTGSSRQVDVVGPICESGDFLGKAVTLPPLSQGDLLAIRDVGAYGFAMSSNYNGRLRAAEVLVDGDSYEIIRPRQTVHDLLK